MTAMITENAIVRHTPRWQKELANAITDLSELLKLLQLQPQDLPAQSRACDSFTLRVPRGFLRRMQAGNPNDPLLLQVLPQGQELVVTPGYHKDPLREQNAIVTPGLLHKYHGRVLLTLTSACAINCRYCFRRHFPYADNNPNQAQWMEAIKYIQQNPTITEVILSGGDPLVIKDSMLQNLIDKLDAIPHLQRLRIHSRLPIVLPQRITPELLALLTASRLQVIMIIHSNHANEIDATVMKSLTKIRGAMIPVLNQSVLLKNINDNADTLITLSEKLFAAGVLPYYLHLLDPVQGAAHFDVAEEKAKNLIALMQEKLPGYLVPRLVRETAGEGSKTVLL